MPALSRSSGPSPALWAAGAAALASVFFGGMVFATRFVIGQTEPITLAFFRCGIGAACLLPVLLPVLLRERPGRARVRREDWPGVAGLGLLLYTVMPVSLAIGLQYTYASRGALVLASQPFLTLLLSRWRGEERLSAAKIAGLGLTVAGLALALGGRGAGAVSPSVWLGDAVTLFAALCVSIYTVWSRPYLQRYPPLVFTALTMGVGALALLPAAGAMAWLRGWPALTPSGWAALLYIGTFGAALGYWLWCWALERTTPMRVAVFLTLNPLTATLLGVALLGEPIGLPFVAGGAIVVVGIVVAHGVKGEGH
jgi:drug/metabolite transporter (DMT)-like permease